MIIPGIVCFTCELGCLRILCSIQLVFSYHIPTWHTKVFRSVVFCPISSYCSCTPFPPRPALLSLSTQEKKREKEKEDSGNCVVLN